MFVSSRSFVVNQRIECDVCVIGAGPVGVAIADRLSRSRLNVIVLESGGLEQSSTADDLARPERSAHIGNIDYFQFTRQFGGNANAWLVRTDKSSRGVRLISPSAGDVAAREHVEDSGWPIRHDEMTPYVDQALSYFGLPPNGFSPSCWRNNLCSEVETGDPRVDTGVFQFGDAREFVFARKEQLRTDPNVRFILNATVTDLDVSNSDDHVTTVHYKCAEGKLFNVVARQVILAAGGIGSVQILLNSTGRSPNGIGNEHDNVGRYFIDHPLIDGGDLIPFDKKAVERFELYDMRLVNDVPILGHFKISDEGLAAAKVASMSCMLFPREDDWRRHQYLTARQNRGFMASLTLREQLLRRQIPTMRETVDAVVGFDGIVKRLIDSRLRPKANLGRGGWSKRPERYGAFDRFHVLQIAEQFPHRDNRVYLSQEKDRLGIRRVAIDWTWHDEDIAATVRSQQTFAEAFASAGIGRYEIKSDNGKPSVVSHSTCHYMGTTRMSAEPRKGVVDANCRVHGIDNLYVATSGVMPTGGYANPTLLAVAFGLRIADHIAAASERAPVEVGEQRSAVG